MAGKKKAANVKITHEGASSPEEKAKRLVRVRNLANLSRIALSEESGTNLNSIKGWEIGHLGGVSPKGARKLIPTLAKHGVICNEDWLLHGIGIGPKVIENYEQLQQNLYDSRNYKLTNAKEDEWIAEELECFRAHTKHTVDFIVADDGMLPQFNIGDYVAGYWRFRERIETTIDKNCIVQLDTGEILFRKVCKGSELGRYNLECINGDTTVESPTLHNMHVISAAIVVRHYWKDSL